MTCCTRLIRWILALRGCHRALIERVFANREIGVNAAAPQGGRQTISTAVRDFTTAAGGPPAPQQVLAEPTGQDEVTVRWEPVEAFAYQVLKSGFRVAG